MDLWVLITKADDSDTINKIYSPDFDKYLYNNEDSEYLEQPLILNDVKTFVNNKLIGFIKEKRGFIIPKTYKQLGIDFTNKQQLWIYSEVEFSPENGFFATVIPFTGKMATALSVITEMFITFMELRISSSKKDVPMQIYLMSLFTTIFNISIVVILYTRTDVVGGLRTVGHEIDNIVRSCSVNCMNPSSYEQTRTDNISKLLAILALSCVILNSAISFTAQRQGLFLTANKFIDLDSHMSKAEQESILLTMYINLIASLYSSITFQGAAVVKSVVELPRLRACASTIQERCNALLFSFRRGRVVNDSPDSLERVERRSFSYSQ